MAWFRFDQAFPSFQKLVDEVRRLCSKEFPNQKEDEDYKILATPDANGREGRITVQRIMHRASGKSVRDWKVIWVQDNCIFSEACFPDNDPECPKCGATMVHRTGVFGAFLHCEACFQASFSASPALCKTPDLICKACAGRGVVSGDTRCTSCLGTGRLQSSSSEVFDRFGKRVSRSPGHIYKDDKRGNRKWT